MAPSPKLTNLANTDWMPAMLAAISASLKQLARLVLARRIADLGGAAADEHDRPVPGLLQLAQHHDPEQIADMEARRGAVEADIAGDRPGFGKRIEARFVGHLMQIAAGLDLVQEFGFAFGHGEVGGSTRAAWS